MSAREMTTLRLRIARSTKSAVDYVATAVRRSEILGVWGRESSVATLLSPHQKEFLIVSCL
jgi:hypothetical protein